MKRDVLMLCVVAFAMAVAAQEADAPDYGDFTLDAQVSSLGEFRTGLGTLSDGSEAYNLLVNDRVRLSFGWERKNLSMKIAAQHTGVWYDGGQQNSAGKIALHEAWAKMTFGKGFFAQVGRQELCYDDERLFGAHDWDVTGRAHDAIRLGWGNGEHQVHLIAGLNQTADVVDDVIYGTNSVLGKKLYKNMQTLWYHFGASEAPFQMSVLFSNQGVSDAGGNGVNYMQTFGAYGKYEKQKFFCNASAYYQMGTDRMDADVKACLLSGNIGLKFSPKWSMSVGDDFLSGSDGLSGTNHTFNLLYGSYHKFLGSMDYFGYGAIPTNGINDVNVKASFKPCGKFDANIAVHWLSTSNKIKDYLKDHAGLYVCPVKALPAEQQELIRNYYGSEHRFMPSLGGELDLEASYRPWKYITLRAGYSMMVATETICVFKGADAGKFHNWGWLSFDLNPTVFSTRHRR